MTPFDWLRKSADEIAALSQDGNVLTGKQVSEVIERCCPFERNVLYMPVPCCKTCANYIHAEYHRPDEGYCDTIAAHVTTDFGCVKWEKL